MSPVVDVLAFLVPFVALVYSLWVYKRIGKQFEDVRKPRKAEERGSRCSGFSKNNEGVRELISDAYKGPEFEEKCLGFSGHQFGIGVKGIHMCRLCGVRMLAIEDRKSKNRGNTRRKDKSYEPVNK